MKKIVSLLMVVIIAFSLVSCGGSKIDPNDPNQGLWKATTGKMLGITMNVEELFGKGFTIELQNKGKCTLNVDGKKANGSWTLDDGAFTVKGGGISCAGRLEN